MGETKYNFAVLRLMRATLIVTLLGAIPAILMVWAYVPARIMIVPAVAVALLLAVRIGFHVWPCPRCGKPYCRSSAWGGQNMFARHCVHCGLRDRELDEETRLDLTGKPD